MAALELAVLVFFFVKLHLVGIYVFSKLFPSKKAWDILDKALLVLFYIIFILMFWRYGLASVTENMTANAFMETDVFSGEECKAVIEVAEKACLARGGWETTRHKYYPTTDISVYDIKDPLHFPDKSIDASSWINATLESRIFPFIENSFAIPPGHLYMRDLFVVKYDANGQNYLPEHRDASDISFNIALSQRGLDFEGGGTRFTIAGEVVHINMGQMLTHDSGVFHEGVSVSNGTRYILIGFVLVKFDLTLWWRYFGTLASCITLPKSAETPDVVTDEETLGSSLRLRLNEPGKITPRSSSLSSSTWCRSWGWVAAHACKRTYMDISNTLSDRPLLRDSTVKSNDTKDKESDTEANAFAYIVLFLLSVLVFLFCSLLCLCFCGDDVLSYSLDMCFDMHWCHAKCVGVSEVDCGDIADGAEPSTILDDVQGVLKYVLFLIRQLVLSCGMPWVCSCLKDKDKRNK